MLASFEENTKTPKGYEDKCDWFEPNISCLPALKEKPLSPGDLFPWEKPNVNDYVSTEFANLFFFTVYEIF